MKCFIIIACCLGSLLIQEISCDTACHDGWVPYNGACFLFAYDQTLPYNEAQHYCMQRGANLARIRDSHDSNFLRHWLTHFIEYPWWIGLNDQDIESEYRWIDTQTAPVYTDWFPGAPKNDSHNYDCVTVQPHFFNWNDMSCVAPFKPICQIIVPDGETAVG